MTDKIKYESIHTQSASAYVKCEECHDTGWGGDVGPGGARTNTEYGPCVCDERLRAIRNMERRKSYD